MMSLAKGGISNMFPTLESLIQAHVTAGSINWTNMWRGYADLCNFGYVHHMVNHSPNFVDPNTGACTIKWKETGPF